MTIRGAATAITLFTGLAVVWVAASLAGLTWHLLGYAGAAGEPAVAGGPGAAPDVATLLALAPFGRVSGGSGPATSAPATALPLRLRGIVLAEPAVASTALIAAADGAPHAYAPGQPVPGGATIETIAMDHVLLRVNGRLETLAFPRSSAPAGAGPARTAPAPVSGAAAPIAQPRSARMLVESLGAAPSRAGYQLGPETAPALRGAGLRPGDIIETINGRTVADLDRDPQGFATAMRAGSARIAVVRDGQRLTFSIPLR